jgi:DNA-binding transcriptional ArsR family regulator
VVDYPARTQRQDGLRDGAAFRMYRVATADLDASFAALSDATRREMIRALLQKPRRAGELAECVAMSPQALSRHLRVLRRAGLVTEAGIEDDARVRVYSVHPSAFEPVQQWLAQVEDLWRRQLHAFKAYAESAHRARRSKA